MLSKHQAQNYKFIAIASVITIVLFVYLQTSQTLKIQNQLAQYQSWLVQMEGKGFDPNQISIRTINIPHSWDASGITFSTKKAYLASAIADFGDQKAKYEIGTKNKFFVLETDIFNPSDKARNNINISTYLTLSGGGKLYKSISPQNWVIDSKQTRTVYVIFVVPNSVSQFSLKSGISGNTKVTALDFTDSKQITTLKGVIMATQGYLPQFPK